MGAILRQLARDGWFGSCMGYFVFVTLTAAKPALNAYTAVTRRIQNPYNISPIEIGVL